MEYPKKQFEGNHVPTKDYCDWLWNMAHVYQNTEHFDKWYTLAIKKTMNRCGVIIVSIEDDDKEKSDAM